MASVLVRRPGGGYRLYCKGAAEMVLSRCVGLVGTSGAVEPMTEVLQAELLGVITEMASRGLRTLCLAYRGERGLPACLPACTAPLVRCGIWGSDGAPARYACILPVL
jgi:magnesium-transporting ATPase (P-type)